MASPAPAGSSRASASGRACSSRWPPASARWGGGLLTAAGLFGPVGPALIILVMLVAILTVHWPHGFFASSNGVELPLLYLTAALPLAVAGPGWYSLDGLLGLPTHAPPTVAWAAIAVAVALALLNVALRRPGPAPAPSHS